MSKLLEHKCVFRVRYAETDKMGVVYNANYLSFFEMGRTELMRDFGLPYIEVENLGFALPLIESQLFFKSPAYYDDILEINAILDYQKTAIIKFDYNIISRGMLIVTGYTKHIFVKNGEMKACKPPKFFIDFFNR